MNKTDLKYFYDTNFTDIKNKFLDLEKANSDFTFQTPNKLKNLFDFKINNYSQSNEQMINLIERIILNTFSSSSKRFFNQLFGGREDIGTFVDMLVPLMNISMYTYKVAGPQVLIEREVIKNLLKKFGFKDGDGIFTPGGSISNLQAMVIARNQINPNVIKEGFINLTQRLIGYTSFESHYSIIKNAGILGIGKNNIRIIKSNNLGQMDLKDLEKNIKIDIKKNHLPFMINITAGTTVLGSFDPITSITNLGRKYNCWIHVDASFGGGVIFSKKYKYLLNGINLVDSISFDAHKMMGVPLNSSIFLTKKKVLEKNFNEKADYLYQDNSEEYNLGKKSLQCGRRNDAFKFWATWKLLGNSGFEKRINKQFKLRDYAKNYILNSKELKLAINPESICVCFEVKKKSSSKICKQLNEKGLIKVGFGNFKNKDYIRLVLVNPNMDKTDIDYFFKKVIEISKEI